MTYKYQQLCVEDVQPQSSCLKFFPVIDLNARKAFVDGQPARTQPTCAQNLTTSRLWKHRMQPSLLEIYCQCRCHPNEETNSPCKGDFGYELMLYGRKSPYKLHVTIRDPDQGDVV
jgi:hypothetical protein